LVGVIRSHRPRGRHPDIEAPRFGRARTPAAAALSHLFLQRKNKQTELAQPAYVLASSRYEVGIVSENISSGKAAEPGVYTGYDAITAIFGSANFLGRHAIRGI